MPIATEDGRISAPVVKCVVIGDGAVGKVKFLDVFIVAAKNFRLVSSYLMRRAVFQRVMFPQ